MKELMQELVGAMVESATDELGNGYPEWGWRWDDTIEVTTQQSRNPSKSRNGGEYFGYAFFEIRPDGVEVWEGSSCELVSRAEEKARSARMYPISLTPEGLERMAHLAEARALQQVAPDEALDPKVAAIMDAAIAMFDSPKGGIGQLKAAVRDWEDTQVTKEILAAAGFPVPDHPDDVLDCGCYTKVQICHACGRRYIGYIFCPEHVKDDPLPSLVCPRCEVE